MKKRLLSEVDYVRLERLMINLRYFVGECGDDRMVRAGHAVLEMLTVLTEAIEGHGPVGEFAT